MCIFSGLSKRISNFFYASYLFCSEHRSLFFLARLLRRFSLFVDTGIIYILDIHEVVAYTLDILCLISEEFWIAKSSYPCLHLI